MFHVVFKDSYQSNNPDFIDTIRIAPSETKQIQGKTLFNKYVTVNLNHKLHDVFIYFGTNKAFSLNALFDISVSSSSD